MESGSDIRELQLEPMITDKRREQLAIVSGSMARARLQAVMGLFAPLMGSRRLTFPPGTPGHVPDSLNKLIMGRLTPTLQQTREVFAALFASPYNVRQAYLALPAAYAHTLDEVLGNVYVGINSMKRLIKDNLQKYLEPRVTGVPVEKFVNLDNLTAIFLRVASQNWSGEDIYSLESPLLELLSSDLDTGLWRDGAVEKLAELPAGLTIYDVSGRVGASLDTIRSISDGPDMQYLQVSGVMRPSSLKIAAAMYSLPELFGDVGNRAMRQNSIRSLFTIAHVALKGGRARDGGADVGNPERLRRAFARCEFGAYMLAQLAMPYVKGFNRQMFNTLSGYDVLRVLVVLLRMYSMDADRPWISVDDITRRAYTSSYAGSRNMINFAAVRPLYDPLTVNDEVVGYTTLLRDFTLPGYRGLLAVLAAMGLVALARDKTVTHPARPYDSLQYVRLTALGRYVTGLDKEYRAEAVAAGTPPCTLDPDYLLISTSNADAAKVVRGSMGRQVSATLYRVDADSFMRNITGERALEVRIDLLRQLTGATVLPPMWQAFTDSLHLRFSAITPHFPGEYVVLDINPECRELVRYITEDSRVRRLVRLVEGNSILVGKDKYCEFHLLMEEAGYHIPEIMWPSRYY